MQKILRMEEKLSSRDLRTRNPLIICLPVRDKAAAQALSKSFAAEFNGKPTKAVYVTQSAGAAKNEEPLKDDLSE